MNDTLIRTLAKAMENEANIKKVSKSTGVKIAEKTREIPIINIEPFST